MAKKHIVKKAGVLNKEDSALSTPIRVRSLSGISDTESDDERSIDVTPPDAIALSAESLQILNDLSKCRLDPYNLQSSIFHSPAYVVNSCLGNPPEILTDEIAPPNSLADDSEMIHLPSYLVDFVQAPFLAKATEVCNDLLSMELLANKDFRDDFTSRWLSCRSALTDESLRDPSLARANAKELDAAQLLCGALPGHTSMVNEAHAKHKTTPAGILEYSWDFASELGRVMRADFKEGWVDHVSLPRTTSQGIFLKSRSDTTDYRLFSKVILALLGSRCKTYAELRGFLDEQNALCQEFGFSPFADCFVQGIRRQASRKAEPVMAFNAESFDDLKVLGYTKHWQARWRGIMIVVEAVKAFFKAAADSVKHYIFYESYTFSVIPEKLLKKYQLIESHAYAMENHGVDPNGEQYCYVDLSAYDTSVCRYLYDRWYDWLDAFCGADAKSDWRLLIQEMGIIAPIAPGRSAIIKVMDHGNSTPSGEPFVTDKNNIVHLLMYIAILSKLREMDPIEVWRRLEDPNDLDFTLHLHGDDCMRYFGPDPNIYDEIDKAMESFGVKVGRETAPAFLKKQNRSDHSRLYNITGSLMKNRFSEYGVSEPAILSIGLWDTWKLIPPEDREAAKPVWELISTLGYPGFDIFEASDEEAKKTLFPIVEQLSQGKDSKAKQVNRMLEHMYYSHGEYLDDDWDRLWGNLQYNVEEEGERLGLRDLSQRQLQSIILDVQRWLFTHDGACPSPKQIKKFVDKARLVSGDTDVSGDSIDSSLASKSASNSNAVSLNRSLTTGGFVWLCDAPYTMIICLECAWDSRESALVEALTKSASVTGLGPDSQNKVLQAYMQKTCDIEGQFGFMPTALTTDLLSSDCAWTVVLWINPDFNTNMRVAHFTHELTHTLIDCLISKQLLSDGESSAYLAEGLTLAYLGNAGSNCVFL